MVRQLLDHGQFSRVFLVKNPGNVDGTVADVVGPFAVEVGHFGEELPVPCRGVRQDFNELIELIQKGRKRGLGLPEGYPIAVEVKLGQDDFNNEFRAVDKLVCVSQLDVKLSSILGYQRQGNQLGAGAELSELSVEKELHF